MFFGYSLQALLWDIAILVLIGGSAWYAGRLFLFIKRGAHRGFRIPLTILTVMLGIGCFLTVYGSFIEPRMIRTTTYDVVLPMEEELTIAVISDLHLGPYKGRRFLKGLVNRVNALQPDFVFMPGDLLYLSNENADVLAPLRDLHPRFGTFASLGNYEFGMDLPFYFWGKENPDRSAAMTRTLERLGVTVLRNSFREVRTASGALFIAGIDDLDAGRDRIRDALPDVRKGLPIILLSHNPDIILQAEARRPHLIVSGHTHGGQIRLPFIGALMGLPTELGDVYAWGKHVIDNDSTIVITRGAGETGPRARLFASPEIVVLRTQQ